MNGTYTPIEGQARNVGRKTSDGWEEYYPDSHWSPDRTHRTNETKAWAIFLAFVIIVIVIVVFFG